MNKIGIFGLGTVGKGLLEIIQQSRPQIDVAAVVDRSYSKKKEILGTIPASDDPDLILKNNDIDLVVELTGGTEYPLYIAREALDRGKHFVTANKALLAEHGYTLFEKAAAYDLILGFEASVAGAIPVIRNLQTVFSFEEITLLEGILNGTSNYLLTRMRKEKKPFQEVLSEAQSLGLAEADPTLDINGMDATHKLALLGSLAGKQWIEYPRIPCRGIEDITLSDIEWAERIGYRIRLIGRYQKKDGKTYMSMQPMMISSNHFLYDIEYENNAVLIECRYSDSHLFVGKGAGSHPTAYSVYADIMNIFSGNSVAASMNQPEVWHFGHPASLDDENAAFYLRFVVVDRPGVLATISKILGDHSISIASVHQDALYIDEEKKTVELIIMTHSCLRRSLNDALEQITQTEYVTEKPFFIQKAS